MIVVAFGLWLAVVCAWMAKMPPMIVGAIGLSGRYISSQVLYDIVFAAASLFGVWLLIAGRMQRGFARYARYTLAFPLLWQASVYGADRFYFSDVRVQLADVGLGLCYLLGLCWLVWYVERRWDDMSRRAVAAKNRKSSHKVTSDPFNPMPGTTAGKTASCINRCCCSRTTRCSSCALPAVVANGRLPGDLRACGGRRQANATDAASEDQRSRRSRREGSCSPCTARSSCRSARSTM